MPRISRHVLSGNQMLVSILFIINSFLGWAAYTMQLFFDQKKRNKNVVFWSIITITFVSLYNCTKVPENDLAWYTSYYLMADRYGFFDYLSQLNGGKEPLYQILVYGINIIGCGNVHIFVFVISMLSYAFLLKTLILWKKELNVPDADYMLATAILCFFPWTFALSAHIIRQFLALSIMLWAFFSYHSTSKKKYLAIAISSIFVHSSVVLFIPFLFIKKIRQPIQLKYLYVAIGIIALFSSVKQLAVFAQRYVKSSKTLAHIVQKTVDGTHFETTLPMSQFLFSVGLVTLGFISVYIINTHLKKQKNITLFLNMSLILLLFIIASSNYSEIQLRYNFFFWSFIAFFSIIYMLTIKFNSYIKLGGIFALFLLWNLYNNSLSDWTYTCANDYFFYPFFWYFLD